MIDMVLAMDLHSPLQLDSESRLLLAHIVQGHTQPCQNMSCVSNCSNQGEVCGITTSTSP